MNRKNLCFVLGIMLLLLLSSCRVGNNIARPKELSPSLNILAELPIELTMDSTDSFEIRIGYGQAAKCYNYATIEINATDFEITDPQGNINKNKYACTISDFTNEKYIVPDVTNFTDNCIYDTFTFEYIGEDSETAGSISIWLTTLQHNEPSTLREQNQGPEGVLVEFFYKIKDQQIIISTEQ